MDSEIIEEQICAFFSTLKCQKPPHRFRYKEGQISFSLTLDTLQFTETNQLVT